MQISLIWYENAIYHVMARSVRSTELFRNEEDSGLLPADLGLMVNRTSAELRAKVEKARNQNDAINFANKDDVLTYLIHLGCLAYDQKSEAAFVPNEEIRNDENSLSSTLAIAYLSLMQYYFNRSGNCLQEGDLQILYIFQNQSTETVIRHLLLN